MKKPLTQDQRIKFSKIGRSNVRSSKEHERRVANLLSAWATTATGAVKFRRRRVEGRDDAVRVVELVADVIPCAGSFHFSIECKKGKDFSLDALMANPIGCLFSEWWHQACYDAQLVSKDLQRLVYPMMFFKPIPAWDWVALSAHALDILQPLATPAGYGEVPNGCLWFPHLILDTFAWLGPVPGNVSHSKKNQKIVSIDLDPVVICRWRDFASYVDPTSAFVTWPVFGPGQECSGEDCLGDQEV